MRAAGVKHRRGYTTCRGARIKKNRVLLRVRVRGYPYPRTHGVEEEFYRRSGLVCTQRRSPLIGRAIDEQTLFRVKDPPPPPPYLWGDRDLGGKRTSKRDKTGGIWSEGSRGARRRIAGLKI